MPSSVRKIISQLHKATRGYHLISQLSHNTRNKHHKKTMPSNFVATVAFYVLLFIATLITILNTTYNYPLFPIQSGSLEWNRTWLITTVIDYYGACLCFCGVVLSTEISWARGLAWVTGFCLLGSPVCCFWVLLWLFRGGGSLKLERQRDGYESPREL